MKKVLVMGGNQFLGKRVCEILLEKKYEVFVINRGNRENLKNVDFLKCDRNNEEELRKIIFSKKASEFNSLAFNYPNNLYSATNIEIIATQRFIIRWLTFTLYLLPINTPTPWKKEEIKSTIRSELE